MDLGRKLKFSKFLAQKVEKYHFLTFCARNVENFNFQPRSTGKCVQKSGQKLKKFSNFTCLGLKNLKKVFFPKNSSRASRYNLEEDLDPFSAITDYL